MRAKELGYAQELWTTRLLTKQVRKWSRQAGHPSLQHLGRGTVSKILAEHPIRPHKIRYYLERRDPDFDAKMAQVLYVYKQVELWRNAGLPRDMVAVLRAWNEITLTNSRTESMIETWMSRSV